VRAWRQATFTASVALDRWILHALCALTVAISTEARFTIANACTHNFWHHQHAGWIPSVILGRERALGPVQRGAATALHDDEEPVNRFGSKQPVLTTEAYNRSQVRDMCTAPAGTFQRRLATARRRVAPFTHASLKSDPIPRKRSWCSNRCDQDTVAGDRCVLNFVRSDLFASQLRRVLLLMIASHGHQPA
jgi:hypothetical protein